MSQPHKNMAVGGDGDAYCEPNKIPSDRDLMIRYRMALEAIVSIGNYNTTVTHVTNIAKQAINFREKS